MQMNVENATWKNVCVLIKHDFNKNEFDDKIDIKKCKISIMKHQLIIVYWMLIHEKNETNDEFLCDEMKYDKINLH